MSLALPKEVSGDSYGDSVSQKLSVDFVSMSEKGQLLGQDAVGMNDLCIAKRSHNDASTLVTSPKNAHNILLALVH